MEYKININDKAKVKLTQMGMDVLKANHIELDNMIRQHGGQGLGEFAKQIDEEGYTSFQLWDLMKTFGGYLIMGTDLPFATEIVVSSD